MTSPVAGGQVAVNHINAAQAASNLRPMCRLLQVAAGTALTSGTQGTLSWDTEDYDYGGLHVAGSANVVVTKAGLWKAVGQIHLPARSDYTVLGCVIQKNTVNQPPWHRVPPTAGNVQRSMGPAYATLLCAVGDTLSLAGFQTNTAAVAVTTVFGSSFESTFEVEYVRDA